MTYMDGENTWILLNIKADKMRREQESCVLLDPLPKEKGNILLVNVD